MIRLYQTLKNNAMYKMKVLLIMLMGMFIVTYSTGPVIRKNRMAFPLPSGNYKISRNDSLSDKITEKLIIIALIKEQVKIQQDIIKNIGNEDTQ